MASALTRSRKVDITRRYGIKIDSRCIHLVSRHSDREEGESVHRLTPLDLVQALHPTR